MNFRKIYFGGLIGFFCCFSMVLNAQSFGYKFQKEGKNKIRIKFEQVNNLIILPITLNDTFELRFIVDTGVRHTIITKKTYTDSLNVPYGRSFTLIGADKTSSINAKLAHSLNFKMKGLEAEHQTVLVLEKDYFELDNSIGKPIHGILGMDMFLRYAVKIDYETNTMTLTKADKFKRPKSYESVDIELIHGKPYMNVITVQDNGMVMENKVLIDCGASLSMMIDVTSDEKITLPQKYIQGTFGQILGGNLEAYIGRLDYLNFGGHSFKDVVTNFQIPFWVGDSIIDNHGLIGGGILSRFDVIFDFPHNKMYLRKNENYNDPFTRDRSGLHIELQGNSFNQFIIADVIDGSPADIAGIQTGDLILKCNGRPFSRLSLGELTNTFQSELETLVKLTILRNNEEVDVRFRLKDLI
jgi:predicted aspartyl protease